MITSDTAFAALDWLSRQPDAFTTGTAANQALAAYTVAVAAALRAAEASAEAAIASASLANPAGLLAAVSAAGNAACTHAAAVELAALQTVLARS